MTPLRWAMGLGGVALVLWGARVASRQGGEGAGVQASPAVPGLQRGGGSISGAKLSAVQGHATDARTAAPGRAEPAVDSRQVPGIAEAVNTAEKGATVPGAAVLAGGQGAPGGAFVLPASVDELPGDEAHEHGHEHGAQGNGGWKAPLTWTCKGERAYLARALSFSEPTPERLGRALGEASEDGGGMLLAIRREGAELLVALSASEKAAGKSERFPVGQAPSWSRLVDGFGNPPGISGERFQPRGYLRVGATWLELTSLNWRATEDGGCDRLRVDVYASLGASQWDQPILRRSGSAKVRELVDAEQLDPGPVPADVMPRRAGKGAPPLPLHFRFEAASVPFVSPLDAR